MPMTDLGIDDFIAMLCGDGEPLTLFLGAGCSASSGILTAGGLADLWYSGLSAADRANADKRTVQYAGDRFGAVLAVKAGHANGRQAILEEVMRHARPSCAYAILAHLLANSTKAGEAGEQRFRAILTTNFDDLLEQAFLIYSSIKPVVINHPSLMRFTPKDKCIIKLHGDYRFEPLASPGEIESLTGDAKDHLLPLMNHSKIVFIGYGGPELRPRMGGSEILRNLLRTRAPARGRSLRRRAVIRGVLR